MRFAAHANYLALSNALYRWVGSVFLHQSVLQHALGHLPKVGIVLSVRISMGAIDKELNAGFI